MRWTSAQKVGFSLYRGPRFTNCWTVQPGFRFNNSATARPGLRVAARPGIGGGDIDDREPIRGVACVRLVAPIDGLFPLRQVAVQDARVGLPKRDVRITQAEPKGDSEHPKGRSRYCRNTFC